MQVARLETPGNEVRPSPAAMPRLAVLVLVLLGIGILAVLVFPGAGEAIGSVGIMVGNGGAGVLFVSKARAFEGRERLAWSLVGAGMLVGCVGVATVGVVSLVVDTVPAFGPLDFFFIVAYAIIVAGFAALPHVTGNSIQRVRVFLDGLVGAVSIAALVWLGLLEGVLRELSGTPTWERWLGAVYPLIDIVGLVVVMIVTIRRTHLRFDRRLWLFGAGALVRRGQAGLPALPGGGVLLPGHGAQPASCPQRP